MTKRINWNEPLELYDGTPVTAKPYEGTDYLITRHDGKDFTRAQLSVHPGAVPYKSDTFIASNDGKWWPEKNGPQMVRNVEIDWDQPIEAVDVDGRVFGAVVNGAFDKDHQIIIDFDEVPKTAHNTLTKTGYIYNSDGLSGWVDPLTRPRIRNKEVNDMPKVDWSKPIRIQGSPEREVFVQASSFQLKPDADPVVAIAVKDGVGFVTVYRTPDNRVPTGDYYGRALVFENVPERREIFLFVHKTSGKTTKYATRPAAHRDYDIIRVVYDGDEIALLEHMQ